MPPKPEVDEAEAAAGERDLGMPTMEVGTHKDAERNEIYVKVPEEMHETGEGCGFVFFSRQDALMVMLAIAKELGIKAQLNQFKENGSDASSKENR